MKYVTAETRFNNYLEHLKKTEKVPTAQEFIDNSKLGEMGMLHEREVVKILNAFSEIQVQRALKQYSLNQSDKKQRNMKLTIPEEMIWKEEDIRKMVSEMIHEIETLFPTEDKGKIEYVLCLSKLYPTTIQNQVCKLYQDAGWDRVTTNFGTHPETEDKVTLIHFKMSLDKFKQNSHKS